MCDQCRTPDYTRVMLDQVLTKCGAGISRSGASVPALLAHLTNHVFGDRDKAVRFFVELIATVEVDMTIVRQDAASARARVLELETELARLTVTDTATHGSNVRELHPSAA